MKEEHKRIIKKIELSHESHMGISGNFTREMTITMEEAFIFQSLLEKREKSCNKCHKDSRFE